MPNNDFNASQITSFDDVESNYELSVVRSALKQYEYRKRYNKQRQAYQRLLLKVAKDHGITIDDAELEEANA
jgi:hypothetical protein